MKTNVLEVKGLSISFTQYNRGLSQREINVISDFNISIKEGEILSIVGASGAGKSLLAHAILGILPKNAKVEGKILYKGTELNEKILRDLRGKEIAFIPQSVNCLNPLIRISSQINFGKTKKIFKRFGLDEKVYKLFPFELSGGMARRVLVTSALESESKLIIADEPTPGLHFEVVNETIKYLRELADKGFSIMLITHDIGTALKFSDRIAVFYEGKTIEVAKSKDFEGKGERLKHPYTKALWRALPQNEFIRCL